MEDKIQKKIALSWPNSIPHFRRAFPGIELLASPRDARDYDLIVFPGGEDVHPNYYGQQLTYAEGCNVERDEFESRVFNYCRDYGKKMFGVCRGHQFINVMYGGQLYQDISTELYEARYDRPHYHPYYHNLEFVRNSGVVYRYFRDKTVISTHHQATKMNMSLRVVAMYDSAIEATEGDNVITLQFHPEFDQTGQFKSFFNYLATSW